MKKMKTLLTTALCLCAVCALTLPASALEYNINAPGDPEYGKPTSSQAAYPSLPADAESSLTPLLLLSPPKPLRWVSAGTPASTSGH